LTAGPRPILEAFAQLASRVAGVNVALPYEPAQQRLPTMPCVTILFSGIEQEDQMTGPAQELRWHFDVQVYVSFADAQRAQDEMIAIVPELVRIIRVNPSLDGTCELAVIEDGLAAPELGQDDRWLRKRLHLNCRLEET
jgi:hypothetical protein